MWSNLSIVVEVVAAAAPAASKSKKTARFQVANVQNSEENSRKNSDVDADNVPELAEHQKSHQTSHQNTHNSGTYNTWYFKSLRHYLTRDVLPAEHNYRNLLSLSRGGNSEESSRKFSRPTLDELHDENGELKQQLLKVDFYLDMSQWAK